MVSEKRYQQLYHDIIRAYTVPQLRDFVKQNDSLAPCSSWRKTILSKYILDSLWKLQPSADISESSDVIVENSISLPLRDLFLIVARNGQLARSWTKSGSKIVVLPDKQQIVIRSTQDTFKWIQISMMNALNNVITKEFDLTPLADTVNVEELPLAMIQRLSDTYIERVGTRLVASALGRKSLNRAERFIWGSVGYTPRLVESYLLDTNSENTGRGAFGKLIHDDALPWLDRDKEWSRWKLAKTKLKKPKVVEAPKQETYDITNLFDDFEEKKISEEPEDTTAKDIDNALSSPKLQLVQIKPTREKSVEISTPNTDIRESLASGITDSIIKTFKSVKYDPLLTDKTTSNITVAATFGDILHQSPTPEELSPKKKDSSASAIVRDRFLHLQQTPNISFLTDVPNILDRCRQLPLFSNEAEEAAADDGLEIENDEFDDFDIEGDSLKSPDAGISLLKPGISETEHTLLNESKSPAEHLENLFSNTSESDITDEHSYYVQMKFLPSPFLFDGTSSTKSATEPTGENLVDPQMFKQLPPMEMWLEIDEDERAISESVNVVFVLKESNTYAALPHLNTDIKFSAAKTEFVLDPGSALEESPEEAGSTSIATQLKQRRRMNVKEYLGKSRLDFSGTVNIAAPNLVYLAIPVTDPTTNVTTIVDMPYMYQTMVYRKQIELRFGEHILQLATIEGGVVSGRRVEANLVLDRPAEDIALLSDSSELSKESEEQSYKLLKSFVGNALEFLYKLETPNKNMVAPQ